MLAQIAVAANVSSITSASITDARTFTGAAGPVRIPGALAGSPVAAGVPEGVEIYDPTAKAAAVATTSGWLYLNTPDFGTTALRDSYYAASGDGFQQATVAGVLYVRSGSEWRPEAYQAFVDVDVAGQSLANATWLGSAAQTAATVSPAAAGILTPTGNSLVSVSRTGRYEVRVMGLFAGSAAGERRVGYGRRETNGDTTVLAYEHKSPAQIPGGLYARYSDIVTLTAGTVYRAVYMQTSGGTLALTNGRMVVSYVGP